MRKYIFAAVLTVFALGAQAQSRKDVANFSLLQQYYNPSLTGFEGSVVKMFYRNQWTGFDNAPRTMFFSGEFDLADHKAIKLGERSKSIGYLTHNAQQSASQALGISVLHDTFGPYTETQMFLQYGSAIWLNKKLSIRWGAALAFNPYGLDGDKLTLQQENDPEFNDLIGKTSRANKADLNLGVTLAGDNFYVGYALHDLAGGKKLSSGDSYMDDSFTQQHIVQGGYRVGVSEVFGVIVNGLYRYDKNWKHTAEGQVKGVFQNTFWISGGYRNDLTYNMGAGLQWDRFRVGYVHEGPSDEGQNMNQGTNEVSLSYNLVPFKYKKNITPVFMW